MKYRKEYNNRWNAVLVHPAISLVSYRIYWINFDYYSQEIFNSYRDAETYARSKSFRYRIDVLNNYE